MSERAALANAAALHAVADDLAEQFHADEYELLRKQRVADGRGGFHEAETVIESGWCALDAANTASAITVDGARIVATAPYTAELPGDSQVRASDRLLIGGRSFRPTGNPRKGGAFDLFTVVDLEERT